MTAPPEQRWNPTKFKRHSRTLGTSMATAQVVTDAGQAYIKVMGNPEGEHALACELVGTMLAGWFGLSTLDHNILHLTDADVFSLGDGRMAKTGPAFATRAITAHQWGGTAKELEAVENTDDITRLVVLDTWLLNPDRHPRTPVQERPAHPAARQRAPNRDNVLLTGEGAAEGRLRLVAIDFSHSFTAGREITPRVANIGLVQDEGIYGLFPELKRYVTRELIRAAALRLEEVTAENVRAIVGAIPAEWQVSDKAREAMSQLICRRAIWLADSITDRLAAHCDPQMKLKEMAQDLQEGEGTS